MRKLKVQFHLHTRQDPYDYIRHSEKELIDEAARLNYDVLSITCHNVIIFNEDLKKYAEKKRILLIPGIEKSIRRRHVVILNATIDAQNIKNFDDLEKYRKKHPECFIIAAHPYYPGGISLKKRLERYISLFDAIEYCWYHSKKFNTYNKKAVKTAEKYGLPILATADCHMIKYLNYTYSLIEAGKDVHSIFDAIRKKKIEIVSHNLPWWKLLIIMPSLLLKSWIKRFTLAI
jgi:predicted metal-dependent phosphoesterase TrpH